MGLVFDPPTLLEQLISFPSTTGSESAVIAFLEQFFRSLTWGVERIAAAADRDNLLVTFGTPRLLFTTHVDVVPAPTELYVARREGGKIFGRGAVDAKGALVAMISACCKLLTLGKRDFGVLVVVGEEVDGIGARAAAHALTARGICFLVNGEPTENKLVSHHKGGIFLKLEFVGKAAHSGYPELGEDANAKLIRTAQRLLSADLGSHPQLGRATVNLGLVNGGVGVNLVSPFASLQVAVRTVSEHQPVLDRLRELCEEAETFTVLADRSMATMRTLGDFESAVASYCTDLPFFAPLGATPLLYGPGSIIRAHTDNEFIFLDELAEASEGYLRIFLELEKEFASAVPAEWR